MSGSGSGRSSLTLWVSGGGKEAPCDKTCVSDPRCIDDPRVFTAKNKLSVCRYGHGVFFLAYALLIIIIIIMVWLASNGSVSSTVNAWVCTFIAAIVIILLVLHAWLYMKGVIPECCTGEGCNAAAEEETDAGGSMSLEFNSGAQTKAKAT